MTRMTTRIGILLSGRGSNFLALQGAIARGDVPAEIALVVSNVADAPGLARARELGLPAVALPHREAPSRRDHEASVEAALRAAGAEWICLAGYMRLLPAFPGVDAQEQALRHGVKLAGCTVHLVDEGLDSGPIVMQRSVPVLDGDTAQTLAARILTEEHKAYPEALRRLLGEPWRVEGRRLRFGVAKGE
jgi:phosphoribosylglycinamide formyltransferase 1